MLIARLRTSPESRICARGLYTRFLPAHDRFKGHIVRGEASTFILTRKGWKMLLPP